MQSFQKLVFERNEMMTLKISPPNSRHYLFFTQWQLLRVKNFHSWSCLTHVKYVKRSRTHPAGLDMTELDVYVPY